MKTTDGLDIVNLTIGTSAVILPCNGGYTIIDATDLEVMSMLRWQINDRGYATTSQGGESFALHQLLMEVPEGMEIDHRNRRPHDNRRENLRLATRAQNAQNVSARSNCGFKGVFRMRKGSERWAAAIMANGKRTRLGSFDSPADAARAYDAAAVRLHGEFAVLNFPSDASTGASKLER